MPDLNGAIQQVYRELDKVRRLQKCAGCECLLDILVIIKNDLACVATPLAPEAQADLDSWLAAGNKNRHPCLGCRVCLPVQPYRRFTEYLATVNISYNA